jgi:Ca2+-binding RTX toxin-like protein
MTPLGLTGDDLLLGGNGADTLRGGSGADVLLGGADDCLAIRDAYNGTGTGTDMDGTPGGWYYGNYWSATPSASGHASLYLYLGSVCLSSYHGYVAVEVW